MEHKELITRIHNHLVAVMPTGEVSAFDVIRAVKKHLKWLLEEQNDKSSVANPLNSSTVDGSMVSESELEQRIENQREYIFKLEGIIGKLKKELAGYKAAKNQNT